ncbi:hypothetical protein AUEXF2481DRAFT_518297 [Aureobasidium subglaciale EXF-2481]|uniref:Uncharacterized protein n=1 Tax=Aureobasidium subglaciale (strain EXF-2481) TaxID=1043005 RepID=A0A074Y4S3_AURSE|nr:uncharacterized protein AUEXF2481DRAFT_518297 [Aureobasidium subglaciale EXF-2481]KEQ90954.1 hypothetical protein AUEXF2481DRAFT_518297 [Aureobasidium subglaciale EXF-2481]
MPSPCLVWYTTLLDHHHLITSALQSCTSNTQTSYSIPAINDLPRSFPNQTIFVVPLSPPRRRSALQPVLVLRLVDHLSSARPVQPLKSTDGRSLLRRGLRHGCPESTSCPSADPDIQHARCLRLFTSSLFGASRYLLSSYLSARCLAT